MEEFFMTYLKNLRIFRIFGLFFIVSALMIFTGCTKTENVAVESVTMESAGDVTTITTQGGTLQMSAVIAPDDATDKSVVWSVENGTGSATISASGLLAAVADGTVTVSVTSADVETINDTMVITISNQVETLRSPLVSAIAAANVNRLSAKVSLDGTDYIPNVEWVTASVMTSYVAAIAAAQAVAVQTVVTQAQVDAAVVALASATIDFNNAKEFGTKIVAVIPMGTAGNYAVLAKTGISSISPSPITGDIAVSPAAATYLTGFSLILDASGVFSTSASVTGQVFASDYTSPTPSNLTTAIGDMTIAYNAGLAMTPDYTELYTGDLSGKTLESGVYNWSNDVLINTALTLTGSSTDVWVFQIAGTLTQATDIDIVLAGGALAENIFWVVADTVAIGVGAHFEGTILAMTNISMGTNSSINGQLLAQTAITLDACTVVKPS